jgi:hypothetical protein
MAFDGMGSRLRQSKKLSAAMFFLLRRPCCHAIKGHGDGRQGATQMNANSQMAPRMQIVWQVLEAAKDAGDDMVVETCRRIIRANLIGWRKHGNPADLRFVLEFADVFV